MSTLVYTLLTGKRMRASRRGTGAETPPGVGRYVDALAALVPGEVLALHAAVLSVTTAVEGQVTRITDAATLAWAFWGLVAVSVGLYVGPRAVTRTWERRDWARMWIPPLAFVAWTMLQRATAFDALPLGWGTAPRTVAALFLAVALAFGAVALAYKVEEEEQQAVGSGQ